MSRIVVSPATNRLMCVAIQGFPAAEAVMRWKHSEVSCVPDDKPSLTPHTSFGADKPALPSPRGGYTRYDSEITIIRAIAPVPLLSSAAARQPPPSSEGGKGGTLDDKPSLTPHISSGADKPALPSPRGGYTR